MGLVIEKAYHIFPLPIENYSVGKRGVAVGMMYVPG